MNQVLALQEEYWGKERVLPACLPIMIKGWAVHQRRVAQAICAVIHRLEHCSDIKRKSLAGHGAHTCNPTLRKVRRFETSLGYVLLESSYVDNGGGVGESV